MEKEVSKDSFLKYKKISDLKIFGKIFVTHRMRTF